MRPLLESIEAEVTATEDAAVPLAFVAAQALELPPHELRPARRRAMLVLAAGGDPHRGLDLDSPAVRRLAAELDAAQTRQELATALDQLVPSARGLPAVEQALTALRADLERAWRLVALALLAEEVAGLDE